MPHEPNRKRRGAWLLPLLAGWLGRCLWCGCCGPLLVRLFPFAATGGIRRDGTVARVTFMRHDSVAVLVVPVLARGVVPVAAAPAAPASAPAPPARTVIAAVLASRERWLLAEPSWVVDRLLGMVLAGLRLIDVR